MGREFGHIVTEQTRKKMSEANKGKKHSESWYKKMKGMIPWNKGKKGVMPIPWNKGKKETRPEVLRRQSESHKGKRLLPCTEERKRKISEANKGKGGRTRIGYRHSEETKKKISEAITESLKNQWKNGKRKPQMLGKHQSEKAKIKISEANRGEKNYFWKGGISFNPYSTDWTETLRRAIRERDNYICQICSQYGNEVHHIDYNKKNCNPENLITLCCPCHAKTGVNREFWIQYFA